MFSVYIKIIIVQGFAVIHSNNGSLFAYDMYFALTKMHTSVPDHDSYCKRFKGT